MARNNTILLCGIIIVWSASITLLQPHSKNVPLVLYLSATKLSLAAPSVELFFPIHKTPSILLCTQQSAMCEWANHVPISSIRPIFRYLPTWCVEWWLAATGRYKSSSDDHKHQVLICGGALELPAKSSEAVMLMAEAEMIFVTNK